MKSLQNQKKHQEKPQRGFALIATITVMSLMLMIAFAVMSLASVETNTSKDAHNYAAAQANARMGLMIAIGELQAAAGADKSITISSSMMSVDGFGGVDPVDFKNRYMVALKTDTADGDTWTQRRDNSFQRYLVSGSEEQVRNIAFCGVPVDKDNYVRMRPRVYEEHTELEKMMIWVPTVSLEANQGKMAYHVDGLANKSSIGVVNTSSLLDSEHIAPDRQNVKAVIEELGLTANWFPQRGEEANLRKLITPGTADILHNDSSLPTVQRGLSPYEDWIGLMHYTVPIDTKRGLLKYDLSALLSLDDTSIDQLATDDTNEIGEKVFSLGKNGLQDKENGVGPLWKQIQSFYELSGVSEVEVKEQTDEEGGMYPLIAGFVEMYACTDSQRYAPSGKLPYLRPHHFDVRGRAVNVMNAHMAPVVKLWNPYNKKLKVSSYTLSVSNSNNQYPGELHSDDAEIEWLAGSRFNFLSYLPKPMRFDHRYVIKDVEFEPGEVKTFSIRDSNKFLDMENGTYKPHSGFPMGDRTDVLGEGYILAELTEGPFTGHCVWDLMFTKKELTDYDSEQLNYVSGRATGGVLATGGGFGTDGGDIQIYDTSGTGKIPFELRAGDIVNWNLQLYKGVVRKPALGATPSEKPLINIKNINMDSKNIPQVNDELIYINPPTTPIFADGVLNNYISSTWARRFSLKMLDNYGDNTPQENNFKPRGGNAHPNDVKWLSYNPRASHSGLFPYEYTKTSSVFYPGEEIKINGTKRSKNADFGLGNVSNYHAGMLLNFSDTDFIRMDDSIGSADQGGDNNRCVLFEVPDADTPEKHFFNVIQLRHAPISIRNGLEYSEFAKKGYDMEDWFGDNLHPAYSIGDSNPSPYIQFKEETGQGRYLDLSIEDGQNTGSSTHMDLSWWMNDSLLDSYYFSALKDSTSSYNPRLRIRNGSTITKTKEGVTQNAKSIMIGGTISVNCTDPRVWKAFLYSTQGALIKGKAAKGVPYSRTGNPTGDLVDATSTSDSEEAYNGYRVLSTTEIASLAEKIAEKVKLYGPFYSMSDFVNRATEAGAPAELIKLGVVQQAINESAINTTITIAGQVDTKNVADFYNADGFAGDINAGIPGYLTQGDLLARTSHLLTVRDDTFVIRAYGESTINGSVARAWCEAVVQRSAEYVDPRIDATTPFSKLTSEVAKKYGRKFTIVSFRWISPEEIE